MLRINDVITVDVVTNLWTDALLPIAAIVISVGTLVWSIRDRRSDQARIKISSAISIPVGDLGPVQRLIGIDVTNVGRSGSTMLNNIHLRSGRRGGNFWVTQPALGIGPSYPVRLEPGQHAKLLIDPTGIAIACQREGIDPESLQVVATTGHGETTTRLKKSARWLIADVARRSPALR